MAITDTININPDYRKTLPAFDFGASLANVAPDVSEIDDAEFLASEPANETDKSAYNTHGFSAGIVSVIKNAARKYGVDPQLMLDIAKIESGGRARAVSPNGKCVGLFQLDRRTHKGSLLNAATNADIAARELKQNIKKFNEDFGRDPTATEIYMMHQQGAAGARAHLKTPDNAAWKNIRRYYKSDSVAKSAIWGNIPANMKYLFPNGVNSVTSADFMALWAVKCEGIPFETALARYRAPQIEENVEVASIPEAIETVNAEITTLINSRSLEQLPPE